MEPIREKADALFAEHATPTHCAKQTVHDQIAPITRLVAGVRKQVLEYQVLIQEMEQAAPDPRLYPVFEHMHQTFGAIEREAAALATSARQVSLSFVQLDRYMADAQADIDRRHPKDTGTVVPVVPVVIPLEAKP